MTAGVPAGMTVPGNGWDAVVDPLPAGTRVSVVVTHYEQPEQLARTLAALARQTHPPVDVVVSDDGSGQAPVVPAGVRLVTQPDEGFRAARARNRGVAASTGDVVVLLDADTTPEPDYVERIARLPALLPEALVVGRRRHRDHGTVPPTELPEPAWLAQGLAATRDLRDADETSYRFVISAVAACSRWLFDLVGGFDETFTAYGGEDWEWAHRAWTHGALLAHEPRAVAWHDGPDRAGRPHAPALLAETLAVAQRVPVPGAAPAALLLGPADPVVTLDPAIAGDALVLTVDSLLAALPQARVLLDPPPAALLRDPRVVSSDDRVAVERSAWRRLHVRSAVTGSSAAWAAGGELLRGPGAPGRVDAGPVTWASLRAVRRAERWARDDLFDTVTAPPDLPALVPLAPTTTVQARWGGWA